MLRLLLVALAVVPVTLYYGLVVILATYRGGERTTCACDGAPRRWARLLLRCSGVEVELDNVGVIDPRRPQILVANHVSWYDVLALIACIPGHTRFVAKKELAKVPIVSRVMTVCGHVFIDRHDRNRAVESLATARDMLEKQSPTIIMFPEGTRSATGELKPFKKGAFVLAIQAGVDVVPAAISGSREIMKKGSLWIRPGTVRVRFGEPIGVDGLTVEDRNDLTDRAWTAVAGLQAEPG